MKIHKKNFWAKKKSKISEPDETQDIGIIKISLSVDLVCDLKRK